MTSHNKPVCQGTVIIFDDSTTNCELCQIYLELEGFRVHIADPGPQGIDAIRRIAPDVILLDIMMPIMDGFEMLEQIKADPAIKDIPVLVNSVHNETPAVVRALQMGAGDFLKKPFDVDELIARIQRLIAFKQSQDTIIAAATELIRRQHEIDIILEKWGREAEAFRRKCETSVINIMAEIDANFKLEQAMKSSEQARQLINQIVDLSRHRLPEYDMLN